MPVEVMPKKRPRPEPKPLAERYKDPVSPERPHRLKVGQRVLVARAEPIAWHSIALVEEMTPGVLSTHCRTGEVG